MRRRGTLSQRYEVRRYKKPNQLIHVLKVVQGTGFEPAKHYALGPKPSPFDHSGTPAWFFGRAFESRMQRMASSHTQGVLTGS